MCRHSPFADPQPVGYVFGGVSLRHKDCDLKLAAGETTGKIVRGLMVMVKRACRFQNDKAQTPDFKTAFFLAHEAVIQL